MRQSQPISIFLILIALAVFSQVRHHEFVYYDDNPYVSENPFIRNGFTWTGVQWAFSAGLSKNSLNVDYWQPVTALSRMVDVELFGLDPGGHHLMNLLFHILNVLLLFFLLKQLTGAFWRSAALAGFFAIHPLQVETVAWVSARKDLLAAFFGFLSVWAYGNYAVRKEKYLSDSKVHLFGRYLLVAALFSLSLMAKPTWVTLPIVLLLLDYWPLERANFEWLRWKKLIFEKSPFFLVSAAFGTIPFICQAHPFEYTSRALILSKAVVNYARYIGKFFYPVNLGVSAQFSGGHIPVLELGLALFALGSFTIVAVSQIKKRPYCFVGWVWFLAALLPTIGLSISADHFMYVPMIGLLIAVIWFLSDFAVKTKFRKIAAGWLSLALLCFFAVQSYVQTQYWKNSFLLFEHSLKIDDTNFILHNNFGLLLLKEGKTEEALKQFEKTLELKPNYAEVYNNIGLVMSKQGKPEEELKNYLKAIQLNPKLEKVHYNIANWYVKQKQVGNAVLYLNRAIQANPNYAEAHYRLGQILFWLNKKEEALQHFSVAAKLKPEYSSGRLIPSTDFDQMVMQADLLTHSHEAR